MMDDDGRERFSTAVWSSTTSTVSSALIRAAAVADGSLTIASRLNFTSAAVTGSPSCQVASGFRVTVIESPSLKNRDFQRREVIGAHAPKLDGVRLARWRRPALDVNQRDERQTRHEPVQRRARADDAGNGANPFEHLRDELCPRLLGGMGHIRQAKLRGDHARRVEPGVRRCRTVKRADEHGAAGARGRHHGIVRRLHGSIEGNDAHMPTPRRPAGGGRAGLCPHPCRSSRRVCGARRQPSAHARPVARS